MSCNISKCRLSHLIPGCILLNILLLSTCDFQFTGKKIDVVLLCLRPDWLPEAQTGARLVDTESEAGRERLKQIRAGAAPNKAQRSVSIPHVVRYPSTTHGDIPLLPRGRNTKHKNTFSSFVFQRDLKCIKVMWELGCWSMLEARL